MLNYKINNNEFRNLKNKLNFILGINIEIIEYIGFNRLIKKFSEKLFYSYDDLKSPILYKLNLLNNGFSSKLLLFYKEKYILNIIEIIVFSIIKEHILAKYIFSSLKKLFYLEKKNISYNLQTFYLKNLSRIEIKKMFDEHYMYFKHYNNKQKIYFLFFDIYSKYKNIPSDDFLFLKNEEYIDVKDILEKFNFISQKEKNKLIKLEQKIYLLLKLIEKQN